MKNITKQLEFWKKELAKQAKEVFVKLIKGMVLAVATKAVEEYIMKPIMRKINQITKRNKWPDEDFDLRVDPA